MGYLHKINGIKARILQQKEGKTMIATEVWLALTSCLLTLVGTFGALAYRDVSRRIDSLEMKDEKLFEAVMTLLISKSDDKDAVAAALHGLMTGAR